MVPYEVEAITPATTAVNSSIQDGGKMREDRVFEPYKVKQKPAPSRQTVQANTSVPAAGDPAAVPATTAESVSLSPGMAALARKEQKFLQQQREFKAQQTALEAERAEIAELKAMKAKLAAKDFSGIESQIPYEDYVNYLASKMNADDPQAKALNEIKTELSAVKEAQKRTTDERLAEAVEHTRNAVKGVVASNAEFSSIKELKLEEAVVQHILDSWDEDEVELSPEQAAKEVEGLLVEQATKFAGLPKLKTQTPAPTEEKKPLPEKTGAATLSNNMAAVGEAKRPNRSYQGMTDQQRWAEARRRAEEKLKLKAA